MKSGWGEYLRVLGGRVYRPRIRKITSPLLSKFKIWHGLVIILGLGVVGQFWPGGSIYQAQERVAWWPWSSQTHVAMALQYYENGEEIKAKAEIEKANRLLLVKFKDNKKNLRMAEVRVQERDRIKQEIKSWEKIIEEKPYYRDVLLRLAILNFQIYNDEQAKDYWEKANYLDPNNEEVIEAKQVILTVLAQP